MTSAKIFMWVTLIILLVAIAPFITIWALNVLFPVLAIPYAFETWAAIIIVQLAIRSNISTSK
jgi:hypothetical protein